jgi:membrane protein
MNRRAAYQILRNTLVGWSEDRALSMGAALAYYTLFSLGPVLLVTISIAGLVWGAEASRAAVVAQIGQLIGASGADAVDAVLSGTRLFGSGLLGAIVGIGGFVFASTALFVQVQDDLNVILKAPKRSASGAVAFIQQRLISIAMLIVLGFVLMISLALDAALASVSAFVGFNDVELIYLALNFLLGWFIAVLIFTLMFAVLPSVKLGRRALFAGAVLSGTLLVVGKSLIGLYLGRADVVSAYGAAGSLILILLWVYYSSQTLFLGAELAAAIENESARPADAAPVLPSPSIMSSSHRDGMH